MPISSFLRHMLPGLLEKKTIEDNYINKLVQRFIHQTMLCQKLGVKKKKNTLIIFNKPVNVI